MQLPEAGPVVDSRTVLDYAIVLVRRKWLIVGVLAAAFAVAVVYSVLTPATYQSTSAVVLRTTNTTSQFPSIGAVDRLRFQRQPDAEVEYAESTIFGNAATALSPSSATVTIFYDDDNNQRRSSQLQFVAEAPNPSDAQQAAAAWAEYYVEARAASDADEIETSIQALEAQATALEAEKEDLLAPIKPIDDALLIETDSDTISRLTTQRLALRQALEDDLLPITLQLRTLSQDLSTLRIARGYADRPGNSARVSIEAPFGRQVAPDLAQNLGLAAMLGVLFGGVAAVVAENWRSVLREPADIDAIGSGFPVLARIPEFPRGTEDPLALAADSSSVYAQAVERVVSALLYRKVVVGKSSMSVLFTSSIPAEGKTSVASHVAQRLGSTENKTILIDADLRRPDVMSTFRVQPGRKGFAELLASGESWKQHLRSVAGAPMLKLLPTYVGTDNAAPLLRQKFGSGLSSLDGQYDMLLVDAPPVLAVTDAEVLAHTIDAVVVVVRAGRTTRNQLAETLSKLESASASVAGFVLVGAQNSAVNRYSYSYSYAESEVARAEVPASAASAFTAIVREEQDAGVVAETSDPERDQKSKSKAKSKPVPTKTAKPGPTKSAVTGDGAAARPEPRPSRSKTPSSKASRTKSSGSSSSSPKDASRGKSATKATETKTGSRSGEHTRQPQAERSRARQGRLDREPVSPPAWLDGEPGDNGDSAESDS